MKRTAFRLLVVSSLLLTVVAMARTRPRYGGAVRIETSGTGWEEDGVARRLVAETLTTLDDKGRVQPALALMWESQNGGRRWQFQLRPGVKFHDGTPLTAAIVAQALSASSCRGCPWRSARAAGENIVFDSDTPMPLLPAQLAAERFLVTKLGDNGVVIGTGPFKVEQANNGVTTLKAFEEWWRPAPYLDTVEIVGGRKVRDQWLDLGVGRADIVEVPADQMRRVEQERMHVTSSPNARLIAVVIESNNAALQDGRLRQAISESIDRSSLLNVIFQRQGETSGTLLPDWLTGFGPLFPATRNLDHARELRGEWMAPIPPLTIGYDAADATSQLIAERVALNMREIGLTVQAVPRGRGGATDLRVTSATLDSLEPSVALEEIAGELQLGAATPDDATPEAVLSRERGLLRDYKAIPLLSVPFGFATSDRVHDFRVSPLGDLLLSDAWAEVRR